MIFLERWFSQSTALQDYQRHDYVLLWLILFIGALARFWGLGNVGLHGDEETMAMSAMAIVNTGQPNLPSGMYYSRALLNIYLMSGSVSIFGESEWSLRLPSAIVGSLTGVAAFFMGRRFLSPQINLAFVATITLLPGMIMVSQTARMYVFFVPCMIWFGACLFRWERNQRVTSLMFALLVWFICLHFQRLAIFAVPLFLFPGLSRQSYTQLIQGLVASVIGWLIFKYYGAWIIAKYPKYSEQTPVVMEEAVPPTVFDVLLTGNVWLVVISFITVIVLAGVSLKIVARRVDTGQLVPVLLIGLALLAMVVLHYHIGSILLLLGLVFWLRAPDLPRSWLIVSLVLAAVISIIHLGVLYDTGFYPGRKLIGALVGIPSVWPILRFLTYSPFAGAIFCGAFLFILRRFSIGRAMPIHILFFVMAVWAPLLMVGFFESYIPPRYALGQLGFFLLCTFAGVAFVARETGWISAGSRLSQPMVLVLVLFTVALVNPLVLAKTVNQGYEMHPDHKGAAEFIQSLDLKADTILIAEDMLQQTYYLGRVDYWLSERENAIQFSIVRDGRIVDQYTGTPVIGTGDELLTVFDSAQQRDVYILGSGENFVEGKRNFRGNGISQVLESQRLDVVFVGRDEKTKVWKLLTSNPPLLK
jgi:hypothetical protein